MLGRGESRSDLSEIVGTRLLDAEALDLEGTRPATTTWRNGRNADGPGA